MNLALLIIYKNINKSFSVSSRNLLGMDLEKTNTGVKIDILKNTMKNSDYHQQPEIVINKQPFMNSIMYLVHRGVHK